MIRENHTPSYPSNEGRGQREWNVRGNQHHNDIMDQQYHYQNTQYYQERKDGYDPEQFVDFTSFLQPNRPMEQFELPDNEHDRSYEETNLEQKDYWTTTYCYEVYYKCCNGTYLSELRLKEGDVVVVEADRGYDVGVINRPLPSHFDSVHLSSSAKILSKLDDEDGSVKEMLRKKVILENKALIFARNACHELNVKHLLYVVGTEFQFDRKKLTVYYQKLQPDASLCKLIRKLFGAFKMRIWMENVTIDTDCESLNMLSMFQPNTLKFLDLTKLPLTIDDVYIFVPGMKERWSIYENNPDLKDENTDLSDLGSDELNIIVDSISPLSSNSVNLSPPPQQQQQQQQSKPLQKLPVTADYGDLCQSISGSQSRNPKASMLISSPYEPQLLKGASRNKKQRPFIHPDYLQYQPHLTRGNVPSHLPPPPQKTTPLVNQLPSPANLSSMAPIKLSHVPPDTFHRIPYFPQSPIYPPDLYSDRSHVSPPILIHHVPHSTQPPMRAYYKPHQNNPQITPPSVPFIDGRNAYHHEQSVISPPPSRNYLLNQNPSINYRRDHIAPEHYYDSRSYQGNRIQNQYQGN